MGKREHLHDLMQNCSNSSALEMELQQSCTKSSIYTSKRTVEELGVTKH